MKIIGSFAGLCEKFTLELGGLRKFSEISTDPPAADNKCQVPKEERIASQEMIY